MHAGFQYRGPQHDAEQYVCRNPRNAQVIHDYADRQRATPDRQRGNRQVARIEQRDDDDRREVVEYRQRQQENLERGRHARAEYTEQRQCKGNIGSHRDCPAIQRDRIAPVEPDIDRRRHQHAAKGADRGQHDLRYRRQFAFQHLALDFQADEKKENRHQAIVDPQQQRFANFQSPDLHRDGGIQQTAIKRCQRRIGDQHRHQRGNKQ